MKARNFFGKISELLQFPDLHIIKGHLLPVLPAHAEDEVGLFDMEVGRGGLERFLAGDLGDDVVVLQPALPNFGFGDGAACDKFWA